MKPIKPTRMNYDFSDLPKYWFYRDPFMTHFIAALSTLFPAGEHFFIQAVRDHRHLVTDEIEQKNISGFIGQEAFHTKEHVALNEAMMRNGIPTKELEDFTENLLKIANRLLSKRQRLAVTVGLEHITAILAKMVLEDDRLRMKLDDSVRNVWIWHATEEIEHKSVSFDVYEKTNPSYVERAVFMIVATAFLMAVITYFQVKLGIKDRSLFNLNKTVRGLTRLYGANGYITRLIPDYLTYFKQDFTPRLTNDEDLMNQWKTHLGIV